MSVALLPREFKELPLALIDEPPLPSRTQMDEQKLEELVASIRQLGLLQPMIVARVGERFEVIAGHRRRMACGRAGLVAAPCIVFASRDAALDAAQGHENTKREELSPADEALWFAELLETKCGGDIEQLCGLVGEKLHYVDNRLALLRGDPDVFESLRQNKIKIGVAHELNKCPAADYRRYYLYLAIRDGATVAAVCGWITEWKKLYATPLPASDPAAPAPTMLVRVSTFDPMRCAVCGESDQRIPHMIPVHPACKEAILDKMLRAYRGESTES